MTTEEGEEIRGRGRKEISTYLFYLKRDIGTIEGRLQGKQTGTTQRQESILGQ